MSTISVQKNNGATYGGSLPKLQRDYLIGAGTKGVFDFATPYVNDGLDISVNKMFRNLVDGGNPAILKSNTGLSQIPGGIKCLNGTGYIQLPDEFKLASTVTNFAVIVWCKRISGGCEMLNFCNYGAPGITQYAFGVNTLTNLPASADSKSIYSTVTAGSVVQYAIEYIGDGINSKVILYQNGVEIARSVFDNGGSLNVPTLANPRIFSSASTGGSPSPVNNTSELNIYRVLLDDLTISNRTGSSLVSADYERNKSRFV